MKNVKLKVKIPKEGQKVLVLQETFEEWKKVLKQYLNEIKGKYIFSIQGTMHSNLPCFFDDETYTVFRSEIVEKSTEEIKSYKLNLETVDEYPEFNILAKPNLEQKYELLIESASQTLKNSLEEISNKTLFESKASYDSNISKRHHQPIQDDMFKDILCKQCFNSWSTGIMFICCECINYSLCFNCETCTPHDIGHTFVMITHPLADDLRRYDCCVVDNKKSYSVDSTIGSVNLKASVTLINNGIEKWEGCFLQSVTFGEMFLNGPKVKIESVIEKLKKIEVPVNVVFTTPGTFKSNWRIFNNSGVPFGELITFELIIH